MAPSAARGQLWCRPLLQGVWQLVPGKGEGFPEDFVPIVNYDAAVNAKY